MKWNASWVLCIVLYIVQYRIGCIQECTVRHNRNRIIWLIRRTIPMCIDFELVRSSFPSWRTRSISSSACWCSNLMVSSCFSRSTTVNRCNRFFSSSEVSGGGIAREVQRGRGLEGPLSSTPLLLPPPPPPLLLPAPPLLPLLLLPTAPLLLIPRSSWMTSSRMCCLVAWNNNSFSHRLFGLVAVKRQVLVIDC